MVYGSRDMKTQSVYETELVYIQNVDMVANGSEGLGINCPNCGAPIKNLGQKFCEYCGTGITEINITEYRPSDQDNNQVDQQRQSPKRHMRSTVTYSSPDFAEISSA